jgi:hypothetical protein
MAVEDITDAAGREAGNEEQAEANFASAPQ